MLSDNRVLREMLETGHAPGADGTSQKIRDQIQLSHAEALYRVILKEKPKRAVEIGMANGVSTLSILTAMQDAGTDGTLISIDPNQSSQWKGVGANAVFRAGFSSRHRLIEKFDYLGLPALVEEGITIDFAYIDGWHTFDYVLLDFFYIDKLLSPGGVVGFNDCGWLAVHKALKFVVSHRKYREIDVGLAADYTASNPLKSLARRMLGLNTSDRYFRKLEQWEPRWDFYARF